MQMCQQLKIYRTGGSIQQSSIFDHPACFGFSSIIMDTSHPELIKIGSCQCNNKSVEIVCTISKEN